jgi:hypothetical protein
VKSILATCKPRDVTIFLVGTRQHKGLFSDLSCDVVYAVDVVGERVYDDLMTRYSAAEACFAMKPVLAEVLLAKGATRVIFTDADCQYFSAPTLVERMLRDGATAVITPHILRNADGRHYIDDRALLRSGTTNSGFFGVSATDEARALLAWWKERNCTDCTLNDAHGTYYEQKWLDLAQSLFDGVVMIRDPAYNVAYWNLYQRALEQTPGGQWTVDGRPLVFFHFSRWRLPTMTVDEYSREYIRIASAETACRPILESYAVAVEAERMRDGFDTFSIKVEDQHLPDGSPITPIMRRALWRNIPPRDGERTIWVEVLNAPSPRLPHFSPYTLTNYYEEFWLARADLRYNKFDIQWVDGLRAFTRWLVDVGQAESGIPECLMIPARTALKADADLIKQRCAELETQVASLEALRAEDQQRYASLEALRAEDQQRYASLEALRAEDQQRYASLEARAAEIDSRLTKWIAVSKGRAFRAFRAYMRLRNRLTGRSLDLPY